MRGLLACGDLATRRRPGLQAAIEHCDVGMACPFEHPPQAATVVGSLAVVHHGLHIWRGTRRQTFRSQPAGKRLPRRQRVASARGGGATVFLAQVTVQVHIQGTCDVNVCVLLRACLRVHQVKAAVKHLHRGAVGVQGLKLLNRNQGGVSHGGPFLN